MKDYRIVYIKGEPMVVEWPKMTKLICKRENPFSRTQCCNGECTIKLYRSACESAIAKGVPPADKGGILSILQATTHYNRIDEYTYTGILDLNDIVEGHPYSLEGYEVKVVAGCSDCPITDCHCDKRVAIITPKEKETYMTLELTDKEKEFLKVVEENKLNYDALKIPAKYFQTPDLKD